MPHDAEKPLRPGAGRADAGFASVSPYYRPFPAACGPHCRKASDPPDRNRSDVPYAGPGRRNWGPDAPCRTVRASSSKTRRPETRPARAVSNCDTNYERQNSFNLVKSKISMVRLEERDAVVPNWVEKGKKQKLPNGSLVAFAGKNDNCIIVKDPDEKFHCNFTIKSDRYEVHFKNEKTKEHKCVFDVSVSVIIQLAEVWWKKHPRWVKQFVAAKWNKKYTIIDINSTKIPSFSWCGKAYSIDFDIDNVKCNAVSKKNITNMKFNAGAVFDQHKQFKGLLLPHHETKSLVLINSLLFSKVVNTALGIKEITTKLQKTHDKLHQETRMSQ